MRNLSALQKEHLNDIIAHVVQSVNREDEAALVIKKLEQARMRTLRAILTTIPINIHRGPVISARNMK